MSKIPNTNFPFDEYKKDYVDANQGVVRHGHPSYTNFLSNPAIISALRKSLEGCMLMRHPNALVTFDILDE